ncbi:MAG: hypothetical protein NT146_16040 [Mycobacterium sp.]|nr:hypothetical protein [Mycobacterium sp.]
MRRVIGPILTTGVALLAACVVVANPIVVPRADVQIPAFTLSAGNDETGGMLDPAFLNAIAPAPSESDNPFSVFKQLITSLAADATSVGRNAIVDAFVAGLASVTQPELTAASDPYAAPPVDPYPANLPALAASLAPGLDISLLNPVAAAVPAATADPSLAVAAAVAPVIHELVSSLVADVGYVSNGLISAAFAVGALVATEPVLVVNTLSALVGGDLNGAVENAVKVVVAPFGPAGILLNTLRAVIENHLSKPIANRSTLAAGQPVTPAPGTDSTDVPQDFTSPAPATRLAVRPSQRNHRDVGVPTAEIVSVPGLAAALGVSDLRVVAARAAATVSNSTPSPRRPVAAVHEAITAIGDQAGVAVEGAADAVGKIAARSRSAQAAGRG